MRTFAVLVGGLALMALLGGAGETRAAGLKADLADVAKQIAGTVGNNPVRVGDFTGPRQLQASAGTELGKELTAALKKKKVKVEDNAVLRIDGDLRAVRDDATGLVAMRVNFRVRNRDGDVLREFARTVTPKDEKDTGVADLLGVRANRADPELAALGRAMLKDPAATIRGARVTAGPKSAFAVELLVKDGDDFVAKAPESVGGRAFLRLKRDDVYRLRLINASRTDAAVTLDIDGINVFAFSDEKDALGDPKYSFLILKANVTTVINGWYKTKDQTLEFVVKDLADSAGGVLKSSSTAGRIRVTFVPAATRGASRAADPAATGLGTSLRANFSEGQLVPGTARDTVVIRYSSK
jgi:hypothetical protein